MKKLHKMNKKGNVEDILFVLVIFLTVSIVGVIMVVIVGQLFDTGVFDDTAAEVIKDNYELNVRPMYDKMAVGILFAGIIGTIALAFLVRTHPAFLLISILYGIVIVTVSVPLANVYDELRQTDELKEIMDNDFTMVTEVMANLPLFTTVFLVLLFITMYGINKVDGGG